MPYQGIGSNDWVKWIVGSVFFLLIAAVVVGTVIAGTYWANPPLREAEAETLHIENAAMEDQREADAERRRIENELLEENGKLDLEARRRKIEDDSQARQKRAEQDLIWLGHRNRFGMFAVAVVVVAMLITVGVRVVIPPVVKAREQEVNRRLQLVQQQRMELRERLALETKLAERLDQEFRLEQVRLQQVRVLKKAGGNGKGHKVSVEQPMSMTPSHSLQAHGGN